MLRRKALSAGAMADMERLMLDQGSDSALAVCTVKKVKIWFQLCLCYLQGEWPCSGCLFLIYKMENMKFCSAVPYKDSPFFLHLYPSGKGAGWRCQPETLADWDLFLSYCGLWIWTLVTSLVRKDNIFLLLHQIAWMSGHLQSKHHLLTQTRSLKGQFPPILCADDGAQWRATCK